MTKYQLKQQIKQEQKEIEFKIRTLKPARKPGIYKLKPDFYSKLGNLEGHRDDYRHTHIAYCTFFNNTLCEEIESNCRKPRNALKINALKTEWEKQIDDIEPQQ